MRRAYESRRVGDLFRGWAYWQLCPRSHCVALRILHTVYTNCLHGLLDIGGRQIGYALARGAVTVGDSRRSAEPPPVAPGGPRQC
jgi:hypothetical protein